MARQTVASVTLQRAGYREGAKVLGVIMQWWLAHHELGYAPNAEQYADWWKCSHATGYRDLARFRACFGEVKDPSGLASVLGLDLVNGEVKHAASVDASALHRT